MLYLITGGSGSGKSEYGEKVAVRLKEQAGTGGRLFYVAAMRPVDEESKLRIMRHRKMREGKGFTTVECYRQLGALFACGQDVIFLECLSNLLANEMFWEQGALFDKKHSFSEAKEAAEEHILRPIENLMQQAFALVVVTNEIFSDGGTYGEETLLYIRLLGYLNRRLASMSENVTEVVFSIPLVKKGESLCFRP